MVFGLPAANCLLPTAAVTQREPDYARIGSGRHHKIVFKLAPVAVINKVDARVDVSIFDLGIRGNVGPPLLRIIPNEVVGFDGQLCTARNLRVWVPSNKFHAKHRRGMGAALCCGRDRQPFLSGVIVRRDRLAKGQHGLGGCQEQRVTASAREKLSNWP